MVGRPAALALAPFGSYYSCNTSVSMRHALHGRGGRYGERANQRRLESQLLVLLWEMR